MAAEGRETPSRATHRLRESKEEWSTYACRATSSSAPRQVLRVPSCRKVGRNESGRFPSRAISAPSGIASPTLPVQRRWTRGFPVVWMSAQALSSPPLHASPSPATRRARAACRRSAHHLSTSSTSAPCIQSDHVVSHSSSGRGFIHSLTSQLSLSNFGTHRSR
jgi:hypothetical protein